MREIKFRQPIFDGNGDFKKFHYWGLIGDEFISLYSMRYPNQEFTGLQDKNSNDVYEGDVCKVIHNEGISWEKTYTDIGVVEFSRASFGVKCLSKQNRLAKDESKRYFFLSFHKDKSFEVIGNIYQTPELLK